MNKLYHGSEIERGRKILSKNRMDYSRGDEHWLGDGIYLYRDRIYAFRWIALMYNNAHGCESSTKNIFHEYSILGVEVEYDYDKVFSFLNPDHVTIFTRIKERCVKMSGLSKKLMNYKFTDGVILNYMFRSMGYSKQYDMVEAIFSLMEDLGKADTRIKGLSEYQLCVKNPEKIKDIKDCTDEFNFTEYQRKLESINSVRSKCNGSSTTYLNRKRQVK